MVDKKQLEQYKYLKQEIKDLELRIEKDRKYIEIMDGEMVTDSVACGRKGKKPIRTVKISGFPQTEYNKRRTLLQGRIVAREKHKTKLLELENIIDEFINSIDDARVRMIVRYKYIDDYDWNKVADKVGGYNTSESVRKLLERYLDEKQNLSDMSEKKVI
jgi:hypothetical protein